MTVSGGDAAPARRSHGGDAAPARRRNGGGAAMLRIRVMSTAMRRRSGASAASSAPALRMNVQLACKESLTSVK